MLADTETEVARLAEVALAELVLLDLEATLKNLLGLGATDGNVDGNLFVPSDAEGSDGVAGLGVDGGLTAELLEHLGRTRQSVTRLADGDVEDELLDAKLPHGVGGFGVGLRILSVRGVEMQPRRGLLHTIVSAALVSGLECRRDGRWLWVCESVRGRCVRPDRKRGLGLAAWDY